MPHSGSPDVPSVSHRQAGGAYLIVLLVLVVLTVLGMALAVITGTEMQIGANERLGTRTFYAAESGIAIAVARVLVANDHDAHLYWLPDGESGGLRLGSRIDVSPVHPLATSPCNLCQINQGAEFARMTHGVAATARRFGLDAAGDPASEPLAERSVTVMYDIQPREPAVESLQHDADQLDRIVF